MKTGTPYQNTIYCEQDRSERWQGGGRGLHAAASGNERVSAAAATADQSSSLCDAQRRTVKIMIGCALSSSSFLPILAFLQK